MSRPGRAAWAQGHALDAVLAAALLLVVIGLRPPADSVESTRIDVVLVAAVIALLVFVTAGLLRLRLAAQRSWKGWAILAGAALIGVSATLVTYVDRRDAYSAPFENGRIVVGDDAGLTADGQAFRQSQPRATPADLLRLTAGRPELVWEPAALRARARTLHALYLLAAALAALAAAGASGAWQSRANIGGADTIPALAGAAASAPKTATPGARRFKVALSFPGEVRERADGIARALEPPLGRDRIFYDRWYAAELARPNMDLHLHEIYRKDSDLLVVLLCAEYQQKEWCGLEWRAVRDLVKARDSARLMFLRLDDAPIEGLLSIDGYLDIASMEDEAVAAAILQRASVDAPG